MITPTHPPSHPLPPQPLPSSSTGSLGVDLNSTGTGTGSLTGGPGGVVGGGLQGVRSGTTTTTTTTTAGGLQPHPQHSQYHPPPPQQPPQQLPPTDPPKKRSHHKKPDPNNPNPTSSSRSNNANANANAESRSSSRYTSGSHGPGLGPGSTSAISSNSPSSSSRLGHAGYGTTNPPYPPAHAHAHAHPNLPTYGGQPTYPHPTPPPARYRPKLDISADKESRGLQLSLLQKAREREHTMDRAGYTLRPSTNNRLFLSLRSGLPGEVGYALAELVGLSFGGSTRLGLRDFPGGVEVLLDLVERWVEGVEDEVRVDVVQRGGGGGGSGSSSSSLGLGLGLASKPDAGEIEGNALDALLVLRNSVLMDGEVGQGNRGILLWVKGRPVGLDQVIKGGGARTTATTTTTMSGVALPPRIVGILSRVFGGMDRDLTTVNITTATDSLEQLTRLMLDKPEPLIYLLDILIALMPSLVELLEQPEVPSVTTEDESQENVAAAVSSPITTAMLTAQLLRPLLFDVLPRLFLITGDIGFIVPLCQLFSLIPAHYLPANTLVPRLISFLLLTPSVGSGRINRVTGKMETTPSPFPPEVLTHSLNLLYHLTRESGASLAILKHDKMVDYLRILTRLLKWDARELTLALKHTGPAGRWVELPEPGALKTISVERRDAQGRTVIQNRVLGVGLKQDDGLDETGEKVGLGGVIRMSDEKRRKIRAMREPERAHAWMAETFVSQPDSSVTQVVFWRAYSAFVQQMANEPAIPLAGTAGDVIKSATSVFPGASAMVITKDEQGNPLATNLFVIAGMRFRRGPGTHQTYACRWDGCTTGSTHKTPADLYAHLQAVHGTDASASCRWTACRSKSVSPSHFLTHVPAAIQPTKEPGVRRLLSHPESSVESIQSTFVTYRPPPLLPRDYSLHYTGILSPVDNKGQPASDAFYASLVLRNLGKALRMDTERAENEQEDANAESGRRARKRRKMEREGAFGLPAPPGLLDADFVASDSTGGSGGIRLDDDERTRALDAFSGIVEKTVLEVLGMEGTIAGRLLDCIGF